jgi:hypothetical protein
MDDEQKKHLKELIGGKQKGSHWWDDYPSAPLVLVWAIGLLVVILGIWLLWGVQPLVLQDEITIYVVFLYLVLFLCIIYILQIYFAWWCLGKKNINRWFTLLALVPFGGWILLLLRDKTLTFPP